MDPRPLGTWELFSLLLRMQRRVMAARFRVMREKTPWMPVLLALFCAGYLGVGYYLFQAGLGYLRSFPVVGPLLSRRIIYLVWGFFFAMLTVSNLVIGYGTFFKNRETAWLITLPVSHRDVFRWKWLETMGVASWALLFLSAPLLAAYGVVNQVSAVFYGQVALAYGPFVVLPALLGSWLALGLVRVLSWRWIKPVLISVAGLALLSLLVSLRPVTETQAASAQEVLSFDQLLAHTRLAVQPWLPSAWLAHSLLSWSDRLWSEGWFYFLVALSNALLGGLLGFGWLDRFFYRSWSLALGSRAERSQRKAEEKRRRRVRRSVMAMFIDGVPGLSRPMKALALKDIRVFWRDPAQWTQFVIFFGLLCIYVGNLRNMSSEFRSPFWEAMISHLNLAASALVLSTLTTRFVFPQFSLEGRRLWIIGLAPLGLPKVLWQKFLLSFVVSGIITVGLMTASSLILHLPWGRIGYFATAIAGMSAALSGLSVGTGALFPNLKEENPSKIVSGFGGTLCLVLSFLYIAATMALLAVPAMRPVVPFRVPLPDLWAVGLAVILGVGTLTLPLALAIRRVKNLEF